MAATASGEGGGRPRGRPRKDGDAVRRRPKLTVRLRPDVRAAIEAAASRNVRSLSEEVESRIEETVRQDAAYGGPESRQIINLMAAAFCLAGPPWRGAGDGFERYVAGAVAVVDALMRALPTTDPRDRKLAHEALVSRSLTRLLEGQAEAPAERERPARRRPAA